jgi:hypothetical protein
MSGLTGFLVPALERLRAGPQLPVQSAAPEDLARMPLPGTDPAGEVCEISCLVSWPAGGSP